MILDGNITIPYKWTTGSTIGTFLAALRDMKTIFGVRCPGCQKCFVPPSDVCPECYVPLTDWIALTGIGSVEAVSTVHRSMPWSPGPPPYTLALIRLDGADTALLHLAHPSIKVGDRVAARFKEVREGSLLDILHFVAVSDLGTQSLPPDTIEEPMTDQEPVDVDTNSAEASIDLPAGLSDVSKLFRLMPSRYQPGKVSRTTTYYFSIDEEKWTVTVAPESCSVVEGKASEEADCFLKTTGDILIGTLKGEYSPSFADLVSGKIKTNRPELLLGLRDLFGE